MDLNERELSKIFSAEVVEYKYNPRKVYTGREIISFLMTRREQSTWFFPLQMGFFGIMI